MAEPKKKSVEGTSPKQSAEEVPPRRLPPLENLLAPEELDRLSALQILDLIASRVPPTETSAIDLRLLRDRVVVLEDLNDQSRQALEKFEEIVGSLGQETLVAIANSGMESQVKLLEGLGLKGYLLTDGKTPVNLFNAANNLIGKKD